VSEPDFARYAEALAHEAGTAPADLLAELREEWAWRTAPKHLERYAAGCPASGATPVDYALRDLALPTGARALAGIHFFGLDPSQPFVGVRAWTGGEVAALAAELAREFALFRPQRIQLFLGADEAPTPEAVVDQHLLVGELSELRASAPASEALELAAGEDPAELAAWLAERYAEVHAARPELAARVTPADAEDLGECAEAGALFVARRAGERVGLFAARAGSCLGHRGAEVVEELIAPRCWGQGLGIALQRAALTRLPDELGPTLWGTIDGRNHASRRTALRAGRRVGGAWWFVPCDGR